MKFHRRNMKLSNGDGQWRESFGRPAMNETWFISGASAQGKSSFVMQLAKKFCEYGKTLYVSAEEGIRQSFQRRLEMFEMNSVGRKLSIIRRSRYKPFERTIV